MELVGPQPTEPDLDPAEVRDLIDQLILLHEMPSAIELSPQQRVGKTCMWCSASIPAVLRPLDGMIGDWSPRACPPYIEARAAKVRTYVEWHGHVAGCAWCQFIGRCPVAMPHAEAHAAAVDMATGRQLVTLICCRVQEDVSNRAVTPLRRIGETSAHHSYTHVPKCRARRTAKGVLRIVPRYEVPPPRCGDGRGRP